MTASHGFAGPVVPVLVALPLAALLAVTSACGSTRTAPTTDEEPPSTAGSAGGSAERPAAGRGPAIATSVTVAQSGGLAGIETRLRVDRDTPGAERVLRLAATVDDPPDPEQAQIPCCDMTLYRIAIVLADGTVQRVATFDGDSSDAYALVQAVWTLEESGAD